MAGMNDEGRQWYVIVTYIGHENKVKEDLTKRVESMELQDYVFQIIIPEVEKEEIKDGKRVITKENLWPGYLLIEMIMTDEAWFVVRNTPNVTGFIGSSGGGAKPFPVMQEELEPIFKQMGIRPSVIEIDYDVNDEVEIMDGPFKGTKGIVESIDMKKKEAKIKYKFMNKFTTASIELESLKKTEM